MSAHPHAQIAVKAVRAEGTPPATEATASEGLCELCFCAPARDRAPNLTGHQLGRPVCRRCGERFRDFVLRAKTLEGFLLHSRERRLQYVANAPGAARTISANQRRSSSGVPTEKQILRGLVTLNASWRHAIPVREGAGGLTVGLPRRELTGLYSSLRLYRRSQRLLRALVSDNVLERQRLPVLASSTVGVSEASNHTDMADLYTLGPKADKELVTLLSDCKALCVDAEDKLGTHLADVRGLLLEGERLRNES